MLRSRKPLKKTRPAPVLVHRSYPSSKGLHSVSSKTNGVSREITHAAESRLGDNYVRIGGGDVPYEERDTHLKNIRSIPLHSVRYNYPAIRTERSVHYSDSNTRINSFNCSPVVFRYPFESYSSNGFYYEGRRDYIRCFSCNVGLKDLDTDDGDPLMQHVLYSPQCVFLRDTFSEATLEPLRKYYAGKTGISQYIREVGGFASVKYSDPTARQDSLSNWHSYMTNKEMETLAKSGLYCTGFDNQICCAVCDKKDRLHHVLDPDRNLKEIHRDDCPMKDQ